MDHWKLLNELRRSVYLEKSNCNVTGKLKSLIIIASKSDDIEFVKSALILKEDFDALNPKRKVLWLTSSLRGNLYPPLPVDIAGPLTWNSFSLLTDNDKYSIEQALIVNKDEQEISQCRDIADCSFVASLISMGVQNVERPQIRKVSDNTYHVNLHFNGSEHRLVSVETSRVPTDAKGNQLSVCSGELMDKIVEMAYLQVKAGSYTTSGSNTAIDTFILTGYVPEVKRTGKPIVFTKLVELFQSGTCLLAVGTGSCHSKLPSHLLKNHDYPVIGADLEHQMIFLQDPLDSLIRPKISFKELIDDYEQLYINWNVRKLFAYEKTVEFFYNLDKCNNFDTAMNKPLFLLENKSAEIQMVWLLLESHLQSERGIAYLRELPKNALAAVGAPQEGACDMGLQLLKLTLPPNASKTLFCHSSLSNAFSIHLYSNSNRVILTRSAAEKLSRIVECRAYNLPDCYIGSPSYYKNPTVKLEIDPLEDVRQVTINLQLLSQNPKDMVNMQIYHLNDHSLQKPIFADSNYTQQRYDKPFVLLSSHVAYKIICSAYSDEPDHCYRLQVSAGDSVSLLPNIHLKQISLRFGGLPFQLEKKIHCTHEKITIPLFTSTNNTCFIRVVPSTLSRLVQVRCSIRSNSGTSICGTQDFQHSSPGGIVLENFSLRGPSNYALIIELKEPKSGLDLSFLTLAVGSSKKLIMDEHFC